MVAPVATGLTVADLERFDAEPERHELIDGELFVSPRGTRRHQVVLTFLAYLLTDWALQHGAEVAAEQDVFYDDANHVTPDVVVLGREKLARVSERTVDVVPDLIVEVSSPSTRRYDLVVKRALYERRGVPEYWFVDLDAERIEVYRLDGARYPTPELVARGGAIRPPHLEGLTVAVDDVLRLPAPPTG
jgi:Uma2 family endonuclease